MSWSVAGNLLWYLCFDLLSWFKILQLGKNLLSICFEYLFSWYHPTIEFAFSLLKDSFFTQLLILRHKSKLLPFYIWNCDEIELECRNNKNRWKIFWLFAMPWCKGPPQTKRNLISSILHFVFELPHELRSDVKGF